MASTGQIPWPSPGRTRDRHRAGFTTAPGQILMALDTTVIQASGELERNHVQQHPCPCRDAYATGEVIRVTDLREESTRWPEFSVIATRLAMAGVAAIPMRLADHTIGTLNLYSTEPREWSDEDIAVAGVLADVATSYVV